MDKNDMDQYHLIDCSSLNAFLLKGNLPATCPYIYSAILTLRNPTSSGILSFPSSLQAGFPFFLAGYATLYLVERQLCQGDATSRLGFT